MRFTISLVILCTGMILQFFPTLISAQSTFQFTIGGEGNERANDLIRLSDGGYAISGFSSSFGSGSEDLYLLRFNNSFDLEWSRVIGGSNHESGLSLISSKNGGFYISGRSNSYGNGNFNDMLLMKTDENGETEWSVVNGGSHHEVGLGMVELPDDNIIIAGTSRSYSITGNGAYIFKSGPSGDPQWGTIFDNNSSMTPPATDDFRDIILCRSQNYVYLTGRIKRPGFCSIDNNSSNWYLFIMKTDLSGEIIWHKYIGGNSCREQGRSLIQTNDGNIVATGFTQSFGTGGDDVYMVKVDSETGDPIWTRTYGGPGGERANEVIESTDGGLILTGVTDSYGAGNSDVFLLKTDQDGHIEWTRTYGGPMVEEGNAVVQSDDLGYLIAGYTTSFGNGGEDIFLIKTDIEGRLQSCDYESPNFVQGTGGLTHTGIRISDGYSVNSVSVGNEVTADTIKTMLCCPVADFDFDINCLGEPVNFNDLSEGPVYSWLWDFGDSNESIEKNPMHLYNDPGIYKVILTVADSFGCTDTALMDIEITQNVSFYIEGDSLVCSGEPTLLSAGPAGENYIWSTGETGQNIFIAPEGETEIFVTLADTEPCIPDTVFYTVDVIEKLAGNFTGDTLLCKGENTLLTAHPAFAKYQWSTGEHSRSIEFRPENDTSLYLIVSDSTQCHSDTVIINLQILTTTFAQIEGETLLCEGDETIFKVKPRGLQYQWSTGEITDSITMEPDEDREIWVEVSQGTCTDTASIELTVWEYADLEITTADTTICPGDRINLSVETTNCNQIIWTPNSGINCTSCFNPQINPPSPTTYFVNCESDSLCFSMDSVRISIETNVEEVCYHCESTALYIPNSFSPNNDGINDVFFIMGEGIESILHLRIFSRWGEQVFGIDHVPANNPDYGWDGNFNNQKAQPGTYIFTAEIRCEKMGITQRNGTITVFR